MIPVCARVSASRGFLGKFPFHLVVIHRIDIVLVLVLDRVVPCSGSCHLECSKQNFFVVLLELVFLDFVLFEC